MLRIISYLISIRRQKIETKSILIDENTIDLERIYNLLIKSETTADELP